MDQRFKTARHSTYIVALAIAFQAVSSAQMGGGTMGGGATNGSSNGGMIGGRGNGASGGMTSGSMGGMMFGSLAGMMGGSSGLTIGSDGTLYITRSTEPQNQMSQNVNSQVAAIDTNGNAKWTLTVNGGASQPALGNDGLLFVTTSDWMSWMYNGGTRAASTKPNLLIIKPGTTSASIVATVPLQGDIASAPKIATDNAGGYIVYVVTIDMPDGTMMTNSSSSGTYLYAFSPSGTQKYRLQLSQGGSGMMGF
jgi:hypothetical protein